MTEPRPTPRPAATPGPQPRPGTRGPSVRVTIPAPLRALAGGAVEVRVLADTAGGALAALLDRHPALRRHLRTETGALREHVNVFVNEEDIRTLGGEATAVTASDVVTIVPSIAGG
jgi:molybdopterin converting factor small subunit